MKKTLLFITLSLIFISGVFAQKLIIKDKAGVDITGTTIELAAVSADAVASCKLDVLNNTAAPMNVKVRKYEIAMLPAIDPEIGYGLTMCWAQCYPPNVFEVPMELQIGPNGVCPNFEGDLTYPAGTLGTVTVKFVFFDIDNPKDTSFVMVNYNIGNVGLKENQFSRAVVSNAYPNPATTTVYFDYKVPASAPSAKIKVSNLLGTTVNVIDLSSKEGKATLNVSDLKNGVYFYSLMINNSAAVTRKFVVNR